MYIYKIVFVVARECPHWTKTQLPAFWSFVLLLCGRDYCCCCYCWCHRASTLLSGGESRGKCQEQLTGLT